MLTALHNPFVAIVPSITTPAQGTLAGIFDPQILAVDLETALTTEWHDEALMAPLSIEHEGRIAHARLLKSPQRNRLTMSQLEAMGCRVLVQALMVDWDRTPHTPWGNAAQALEGLETMRHKLVGLGLEPTAAYTTLQGLRLVWSLDEPLAPADFERLAAGFWCELYQHQITTDPLFDSTRVQKLPKILRSGAPTWEQPWLQLCLADTGLDPRRITFRDPTEVRSIARGTGAMLVPPRALSRKTRTVPVPINDKLPDAETAWTLAWKPDGRPQPWAQELRSYLSMDLRTRIYVQPESWASGARNTVLASAVGSICRAAVRIEGASPEAVYGLLIPLLQLMEPDEETKSWFEIAWSMVVRFWVAQTIHEEQLTQTKKETVATLVDKIRSIYPDMHGLEDERVEASIAHRAILAQSYGVCYTLEASGEYSPFAMQWDAAVRRVMSCPVLSPFAGHLVKDTGAGRYSDADYRMLRTPIQEVHYRSWGASDYAFNSERGWVLTLRCHRVDDTILPVYHHLVDVWLRELAGESWPVFERYLMSVTNTRYPTAALSLHGVKHAGKGLLAACLAALFRGKVPVRDYGTSDFTAELLIQNPVFFYDEMKPEGMKTKRIDGLVREMSVGGTFLANRKYRDRVTVELYPRFVFAANNEGLIAALMGSGEQTRHDTQAIGERVIILKAGAGSPGAMRRLEADHRAELVHVVTQHMRWMAESVPEWKPVERFLVGGNAASEAWLAKAGLRSASAQAVLRVLAGWLGDEAMPVPCTIVDMEFRLGLTAIFKRLEYQRINITHHQLANTLRMVDAEAHKATRNGVPVYVLRVPVVVRSLLAQDIDLNPNMAVRAVLRDHEPHTLALFE